MSNETKEEKKDRVFWEMTMRNLAPFLQHNFRKGAETFGCDFYDVFLSCRYADGDINDVKNVKVELRCIGKRDRIDLVDDPTTGSSSEMEIIRTMFPMFKEEMEKLRIAWKKTAIQEIYMMLFYKRGTKEFDTVDAITLQFRDTTGKFVKLIE